MTIRKLESGYFIIRGEGPCNWAQVPIYPCSEAALRQSAFPECSEDFILSVIRQMEREYVDAEVTE